MGLGGRIQAHMAPTSDTAIFFLINFIRNIVIQQAPKKSLLNYNLFILYCAKKADYYSGKINNLTQI